MSTNNEAKERLQDCMDLLIREEDVSQQGALRILLTGLRLLADQQGIDFHLAIEGSCVEYLAEKDVDVPGGIARDTPCCVAVFYASGKACLVSDVIKADEAHRMLGTLKDCEPEGGRTEVVTAEQGRRLKVQMTHGED